MPGRLTQTFSDPDQVAAVLRTGNAKYKVIGRGTFHAELTAVPLAHITVQRGRESLPRVAYHGMGPNQVAILGWLGEHPLPVIRGTQMRPGEFMSHGRDMESYHRTVGSIDHVAVTLNAEDLARGAIDLTGRALCVTSGEILRPSDQATAQLLSVVASATRIAQAAPDILSSEAATHGLEQALMYAMIMCLMECSRRREPAPRARHTQIMARFAAIVEAHADRALHVPELCALLGVPERTLRKCCHQHLGMGPHQYLLRRRMHLAQRALLQADPHSETVTGIATNCGFWELGRFAVVYRSMFGEPPSDTLRRAPEAPMRVTVRASGAV